MTKTMTALVLSLSLMMAPAANAEPDTDMTLARIAVGLTTALILAQLLTSDDDQVPVADRGGLRNDIAPPVTAPAGARIGGDWTGRRLPRKCKVGSEHYDGDCLRDQLPVTAPLPNICAERVMHRNRVSTLYHDGCLRAAGYR